MQFELDITLLAITAALAVRFGVLAATLPLLDIRSVPPLWRVALAVSFAAALAPGIVKALPEANVSLSCPRLAIGAMRIFGKSPKLHPSTLTTSFVAVTTTGVDVA